MTMNHINTVTSAAKSSFIAVLAIASLLLVGCGGGGGGSSSGGSVSTGSGSVGSGSGGSSGGGSSTSSKSIAVSWDAPSRRENGDTLHFSEIVSYEIRYKAISDPIYSSIVVDGGLSTSSHILELDGVGEYQITISAIDDENVPSAFSDPVTITI